MVISHMSQGYSKCRAWHRSPGQCQTGRGTHTTSAPGMSEQRSLAEVRLFSARGSGCALSSFFKLWSRSSSSSSASSCLIPVTTKLCTLIGSVSFSCSMLSCQKLQKTVWRGLIILCYLIQILHKYNVLALISIAMGFILSRNPHLAVQIFKQDTFPHSQTEISTPSRHARTLKYAKSTKEIGHIKQASLTSDLSCQPRRTLNLGGLPSGLGLMYVLSCAEQISENILHFHIRVKVDFRKY